MSKTHTCPDCDVEPGEKHHPGCDVARCSICGTQLLSCDCEDGQPDIWSGEWPGIVECTEKGWYCQGGFGYQFPWRPCGPKDIEAREDLNRLGHWQATGRDDMYKDCTLKPITDPDEYLRLVNNWRIAIGYTPNKSISENPYGA